MFPDFVLYRSIPVHDNVIRKDVKKTNTVMLVVLLLATVAFFLSEVVAGWFEWEHGKEFILIPYTIAYFVGLAFAVVGIPVSLIALARYRDDRRASVIAGINCLASLIYVLLLWVLPVVTGLRARAETEKQNQKRGMAERFAAPNGWPPGSQR